MSGIQIGTIRIPEGTTFRNSFGYAAWYQDGVTGEEQAVPVTLSTVDGRAPKDGVGGYWVTYGYKGIVTGSDFTSGFGGVQYGSKHDEDVGETVSHHVQTYAYSFAEMLAHGGADRYRVTLAPEWGVKVTGIATRHPGNIEYAMYAILPRELLITEQHTIKDGALAPLPR